MAEEYVIGIDSGTQSTRAILFDLKGRKRASAVARHPALTTDEAGLTVHGYEDIYGGLCSACRSLMAEIKNDAGLSGGSICAIGVAAQRATVFFLDKKGEQLRRPVSWMDRSWQENEKYSSEWKEKLDAWQYFLVNYSRMNWMRRNEPRLYEEVDKYLTTAGYINYRLTGGCIDTFGNNLGMPVDRERWSLYEKDDVYKGMGVVRGQLAHFINPGEIVGTITKKAAKETGLPFGCPVTAGGGDKQCEILGSGTLKRGQAYITMGTMTGLNIVDDQYIADEYQVSRHRTYTAAVPGLWNAEAVSPRGFWLVSWFRDNFAGNLNSEDKEKTIEAILDGEATNVPPGAEGLITIPDWKSTWDKPYAKGAFFGFDMRHGRAHLFRSLLEGIMMQLKISTDDMCRETGRQIKEMRVGGGGSKSEVAVQAIADIFNCPVKKSEEPETCSLGAAVCAAVGAGCFPDFDTAARAMGQNYRESLPSAEHHKLYEALTEEVVKPYYHVNEQLLKRLQKIYNDMY